MSWRTVAQNLGGVVYRQIIPIDDTREHSEEIGQCWCDLKHDDEEPTVLIHEAADGRLAFEKGERKPS
jgi:hypothetical protein